MTDLGDGRVKREVATGAIWSVLGWVLGTLGGPVLVVVLVRRMSRPEFGTLAAAMSAISIAIAVASFGLPQAVARYGAVARVERGGPGLVQMWREMRLVLLGATAVAAALGGLLLTLSAGLPRMHPLLVPVAVSVPSLLLAPVSGAATGFLRAAFRPRWTTIAGTAASVTAAAVIVPAVVLSHPTAWIVASARTAGAVATSALLLAGVTRFVRRAPPGSPPADTAPLSLNRRRLGGMHVLRFGLAVQLGGLLSLVVAELGVLVLGATHGSHATGLFAPAVGVSTIAIAIPGVLASFLLPGLAPAAERADHREVAQLFHWSSRWSMVLMSPVLTVIVVCPAELLRVLFGAGLVGAAGPLRVLGLGCIAQIAFGFNGLTVTSYGLARLLAMLEIVDVLVAIGAVGLLVPHFGAIGAAWAATIAIVFSNALNSGVLWWKFSIPPVDTRMALTVAGLGLAIATSAIAPHMVSGAAGRVAVSALWSGAVAAVVGLTVAGRDERHTVFELITQQLRSGRTAA